MGELPPTRAERVKHWFLNTKVGIAVFVVLALFAALLVALQVFEKVSPAPLADLVVAPPDGHSFYEPLDGMATKNERLTGDVILCGGAKLRFYLAHDHASKHSILVHRIVIEIIDFSPGLRPEYAYRPDASHLPLGGEARINTFRVALAETRVTSVAWIRKDSVHKAEAPSINILSLPEPLIFKLESSGDDVEWFEGTLLPIAAGVYTVTCKVMYSVGGRASVKSLDTVKVYYKD